MYNFFASAENIVLLIGLVSTFVLTIFAFFCDWQNRRIRKLLGQNRKDI